MAIPTLTLGGFNLTDWAGTQYATSVIAEGTSRGAPVPIEVAVRSWLQDGSIVATQGYDNRTVSIRVKLRGASLTAVANAEAALHLELGKPNLLTWTPASGPASVFVVVTSSMEHSPSTDEDLAEGLATPWRTYNLRLLCEAFVRSTAEVITVARAPGGTTTTTLDTCSAATGWTGFANGASVTVTNASGENRVTPASGSALLAQQKTFSATTTSTNLLMVDWFGSQPAIAATGDGAALTLVGTMPSPITANYYRSYFFVSAASLAVVRLENANSTVFAVTNVAVTDAPPAIGTNRQRLWALDVKGSARAQAALTVESETSSLGDVMVYVYPESDESPYYTPPLQQYHSGGNTNTGPGALSGHLVALNSPGATHTIGKRLLPSGGYLLMARIAGSGGVSVGKVVTTFTTLMGSVTTGTVTVTSPTYTFGADDYSIVALGRVILPTTDLPVDSSGSVQVTMVQSLTSGPNLLMDEAWLFHNELGSLTWVNCGTGVPAVGGPSKRLFIEPPTVDTPRPTIRVGHSADRSDSFYPVGGVKSWQMAQFRPQRVSVLAVVSNAVDAKVSMRHTPTWHSHAAS